MRAAKELLRRRMRDQRESLPPEAHVLGSEAAARHLLALPQLARAQVVALFGATKREIDTSPVHAALRARGTTIAYPRVIRCRTLLAFHAVGDPTILRASESFGVPEPPEGAPEVMLADIQVFVVPGLAFDASGARVGWGRGHYDRTLATAPHALRVGYAFDFQIVPEVPAGAGDELMDVLCTERGARVAVEGRLR